jgi:hypothetical protein
MRNQPMTRVTRQLHHELLAYSERYVKLYLSGTEIKYWRAAALLM